MTGLTDREAGMLLEQVQGIAESIKRLEEATLPRIEGKVDHTNGRVRALEISRARMSGVFAVAVFVVPLVVQVVVR